MKVNIKQRTDNREQRTENREKGNRKRKQKDTNRCRVIPYSEQHGKYASDGRSSCGGQHRAGPKGF